ncbi:MAG: amidohydrolase family protein [Rhodospirillales bacterium]|jgi:predicted TIM-barrel fold metal-dependent hydrolase
MFRIDTHAHVISLDYPLNPDRRHTPHEAIIDDYLRYHDENNITHGVLVQPSTHGFDNTLMCECIAELKGRVHGIVMIDPSVDDAALDAFAENHIVGVRFSLFDMSVNRLGEPEYQDLIKRLAKRDWIIEALIQSPDVPAFFKHVAPSGARMVINHFGMPDASLGVNDPSFQAMLKEAESGNLWVKVSAPYRCGGVEAAKPFADALMKTLGPERLLWGSDWPWTQFQDAGFTYPMTLEWFEALIEDEKARAQILGDTAAEFYGFK